MAGADPQPGVSGGCSASREPSSSLKPLTLKFDVSKEFGCGCNWMITLIQIFGSAPQAALYSYSSSLYNRDNSLLACF